MGKLTCPIVLRMIMGRWWGQGPTHSQNLQKIFADIPGLKVVIPSNPQNAYSLLSASILSSDPIIFLEHRQLDNMKGNVNFYKLPIINDLRVGLKQETPLEIPSTRGVIKLTRTI